MKQVCYRLNYIYYGLYFCLLASLQVFHLSLLKSSGSWLVHSFYTVYVLGAVFVEVLALAFVSSVLLSRRQKKSYIVWTIGSLMLLILRVVDFPLERLMDISVWFGLQFGIKEASTNLIEVLRASTIPLSHWCYTAIGVVLFMLIGMRFVLFTERLSQKRALCLSVKRAVSVSLLCGLLLVSSEVVLLAYVDARQGAVYAKALPWKGMLFPLQTEIWSLEHSLQKTVSSKELMQLADSNLFSLEKKPDIFLFITESLRADYLTKEVAPHLTAFAETYTAFPKMLSVANATHISWFSTLYSLFPFYWKDYQPSCWQGGSPVLELFHKMGYEIYAYSATRLNFYSMRTMLFGKEDALMHEVRDLQDEVESSPCMADARVLDALSSVLQQSDQRGGRLFLLFLDSTHFAYSWPQEETQFLPIEEEVSYMKLAYSRDNMHKITNRYKNAIHYVDTLFHRFTETLCENDLFDDAVIVFTGDHAESFDEDGHMFHASSLSIPQLKVPLFMKLGADSKLLDSSQATSQIDIFPTLLHYVFGEELSSAMFHGKSLLVPRERSFTLGARYNAGDVPFQFSLGNGSYRAILEFCDPSDLFHCRQLKVCHVEDLHGNTVPFSSAFMKIQFQHALDVLFP